MSPKKARLLLEERYRKAPIQEAIDLLLRRQEEGFTHATVAVALYEKNETSGRRAGSTPTGGPE